MSEQIWWYTARAGGIVAWFLLAGSVLWGLAISTRTTKARPNWKLDLHRFLGGMAVIFTGVHVLGLVADSYVHFGISEVLVPFASTYRAGAVAWGVVAVYLLLAVELTSLARKRLPKKVWRMTHGLAFPLFAFSAVHALTAGTDAGSTWFQVSVIATTAAVAILTALRVRAVLTGDRDRPPVRTAPQRPLVPPAPTAVDPLLPPPVGDRTLVSSTRRSDSGA